MADPTQATTPTTPAAPAPGTPEHDAAMAAKMDKASAPPAAPEGRPAWLPEKFTSPEAMAQAYAELEKKLGAPAAPAPAAPPQATPPAEPQGTVAKLGIPDNTQAAKDAAEAAKIDFDALSKEFMSKGDITPESRKALEQAGYPQHLVDAYLAGQKALAAEYDSAAFQTAGGQDKYMQMTEWAKTGLTAGEQAAFNAAVVSGDKATMQLAVSGLAARHAAALGNPGTTLQGGPASNAGDTYTSMAQVTADMKKPEYKKDPAFRAAVAAKLDRSDVGRLHQPM